MIRSTFLHIPHVGPVTERRLWQGGIRTWGDFAALQAGLPYSAAKKDWMRRWLDESRKRLACEDYRFFAKMLPSVEQWRAFDEFGEHAAFVDIETNGGLDADDITVVGAFIGRKTQTFVRGRNLDKFPAALEGVSLLVTFNGAQFDLPFLRRRFPHAQFDQLHIDLRFALRRLGLRGGLKAIESQLGLVRSEETTGMNGYDAVILWRRFQQGDKEALRLLVQYNREDVGHLLPLARHAYAKLREQTCELGRSS